MLGAVWGVVDLFLGRAGWWGECANFVDSLVAVTVVLTLFQVAPLLLCVAC